MGTFAQSLDRIATEVHRPRGTILDQYGRPFTGTRQRLANRFIAEARRQAIRGKYDAAQTFTGNENHWANTDNLDPHQAASPIVRRTLRSRSRYEILENNPFLKGVILTIANDFVGSGPKLQITDKRLSKERRQAIETRWNQWTKLVKFRQKVWASRVSKIVAGEGFLRAYQNPRLNFPIKLDLQPIEPEQCTTEFISPTKNPKWNEIDGVRFDDYNNPVEYHILQFHPGFSPFGMGKPPVGKWVNASFVIHWFRQDRGWLRGIPETTPSLPLCSILRRYTLAVTRHAEVAADFTAIIETEGPGSVNPWTDGAGNLEVDDPFDVFPIEQGMITNLPWGYKMKQLNPVPLGVQYDEFVGSLLREITRPLLVPYNITVGTSKDSNMASAVVDQQIYKGGQQLERYSCNESVLDPVFSLFWMEATHATGFLGDDLLSSDPQFREPPEHTWRWDRIGLDHTDPQKVANALATLHDKKFLTDRDIQEIYYNRDVEAWREEVLEDDEFRQQLTPKEPVSPKEEPEEEEADD